MRGRVQLHQGAGLAAGESSYIGTRLLVGTIFVLDLFLTVLCALAACTEHVKAPFDQLLRHSKACLPSRALGTPWGRQSHSLDRKSMWTGLWK
jgi:hypothetical protein